MLTFSLGHVLIDNGTSNHVQRTAIRIRAGIFAKRALLRMNHFGS